MILFQQFDLVIEALQSGQPVDLSKMPPPPTTQSNSCVLRCFGVGQKVLYADSDRSFVQNGTDEFILIVFI